MEKQVQCQAKGKHLSHLEDFMSNDAYLPKCFLYRTVILLSISNLGSPTVYLLYIKEIVNWNCKLSV